MTVLRSLGYSISALCQIFFYTYGGDVIQSASDGIVQSYYDSMWYEASHKQRKNIITAMIMAQAEVKIDAGLVELSLNTFGRASEEFESDYPEVGVNY